LPEPIATTNIAVTAAGPVSSVSVSSLPTPISVLRPPSTSTTDGGRVVAIAVAVLAVAIVALAPMSLIQQRRDGGPSPDR